MMETPYVSVTDDIEIKVFPVYMPEKSRPEVSYYYYSYVVAMTNIGNRDVKLERRHWVIRDGNKKTDVVDGAGVIGQFPILKPGETFRYQSFCPLSTPTGAMRGYFLFKDLGTEEHFKTEIPLFFLRLHDQLQADGDSSQMYQRLH